MFLHIFKETNVNEDSNSIYRVIFFSPRGPVNLGCTVSLSRDLICVFNFTSLFHKDIYRVNVTGSYHGTECLRRRNARRCHSFPVARAYGGVLEKSEGIR